MQNEDRREKFAEILRRELIPALGCTEPIAVAYAAAKARQVLGEFPTHLNICCSGNIIKNVKGALVPNSGGMKGVDAAAVLGAVGGDADRELEVLESVGPDDIARARELLQGDFFTCRLQENVANLYIVATASTAEHSASVTIINRHTLITSIVRDGAELYRSDCRPELSGANGGEWVLNIADILEFADTVEIEQIRGPLEKQIELNSAIARAGLTGGYGAQVGRTLSDCFGDSVWVRARALAASGSDARMNGCSLPVVINSGSGNQGMTVSLPVITFAQEWQVPRERLLRALAVSNLISIHLKHYIGSLSAFCGAVTAACGAGAAVTYLAGGSYEQVSATIINTLANVGGIVCDGAKASCAAKIASAVDAALLGHCLSMKGRSFRPGDGLVLGNVEDTIRSVGYVGRVGMRHTDEEILKIMLGQAEL